MSFIQTYAKELVSLLVPLLTLIFNRVFKSKAKLQIGNPHKFTFLVQQPLLDDAGNVISRMQTIHTSSFVLKNAGAETAKTVELVFNWKPDCANIWPSRHFTEHSEPDGRFVMIFDNLAPAEVLGCEILSVNKELPILITARSEQCVAQPINLQPQQVVKPWVVRIVFGLFFIGLGFSVYVLIVLLQFLILRTPQP